VCVFRNGNDVFFVVFVFLFMSLKFGSLFAGIGGFDLGFERAGMECAWHSTGNKTKVRENVETEEEYRKMTAGNFGQLNPVFVEWLMGFPTGWTDLEPSATRLCRRWQSISGGR